MKKKLAVTLILAGIVTSTAAFARCCPGPCCPSNAARLAKRYKNKTNNERTYKRTDQYKGGHFLKNIELNKLMNKKL